MILKSKPADFNKKFDVVGCLVQCNGEFVLLRRQPHKSSPNAWGLPAGKKDEGETIEQAMLREIKEETGLEVAPENLHYSSSAFVREGSSDFHWHMFSTDYATQPKITVNPKEHSEFRWVRAGEVLQMPDTIHDLKECVEIFYKI